jgi:hypothetical protein
VLRGFFRRKIVWVGVTGVAAAGVMVGVAFAYWTVTGSGTGSATTGSGTALTVNQTVAPTGLYPGGAAALSGNFDNHNAGQVYVTAVTASVTAFTAQADPNKPACTQADFAITGTANVGAEIASGNGVGAWSGLSLGMTDRGTNQDNCKNITVPIAYAVS